jgi:hypothetical protein
LGKFLRKGIGRACAAHRHERFQVSVGREGARDDEAIRGDHRQILVLAGAGTITVGDGGDANIAHHAEAFFILAQALGIGPREAHLIEHSIGR